MMENITEEDVQRRMIPIYEEMAQRRKEYREYLWKNFPGPEFA
jgi:hypothetical protein